jgi:hypothetical protein
MFTMAERIAVYKKTADGTNATDVTLAGALGVSEPTIRRWKKLKPHGTQRRAPRAHEESLQRMLRKIAEFPWSFEADHQTFILYQLTMQKRFIEIHDNFAFSAELAFSVVERIDLRCRPFSAEQWGAVLFAYHFYLAMCMAANSAYSNSTAKSRLTSIADRFAAMVKDIDRPWAKVMTSKIAANQVDTTGNRVFISYCSSPAIDTGLARRLIKSLKSFPTAKTSRVFYDESIQPGQ